MRVLVGEFQVSCLACVALSPSRMSLANAVQKCELAMIVVARST
jgi:hypothetical protein